MIITVCLLALSRALSVPCYSVAYVSIFKARRHFKFGFNPDWHRIGLKPD